MKIIVKYFKPSTPYLTRTENTLVKRDEEMRREGMGIAL